MANNCCVGIQIVTCNADCGEYLYDHLKVAKMAADAEKTGLYIGCRERRLFDTEIFRDGDTLFIPGWFRSGFTDADVKTVIAWLTVQAGCKEFRMSYDDRGNHLFGEYSYAGGVLVKCHLPEINYPEDTGDRDFGITLESALKKYGVAQEIPMP